ncbi:MAG: Spy/CpxP family protein refolding chaperone [Planctomycetaceae bacterium]
MSIFRRRVAGAFVSAVAGIVFSLGLPLVGQVRAEPPIARQLRELRSKVAKLESALRKNRAENGDSSIGSQRRKGRGRHHGESGNSGASSRGNTSSAKPGMAKTKGKTAMGKKSMTGGKMAGMGMMKNGMGMGMMGRGISMMGRMKGMGRMTMPSALPGFPGASHIYHIGATGFFLDHPQHITLSLEQKTNLNRIKEDALLKQATLDRRIEDAEQELWVLTSADKPDAAKIETKVRAIAKLGGDKRVAFIRAVGQAATVLRDEQRKRLVGASPADHKSTAVKSRK